jgi:hypothetical protein
MGLTGDFKRFGRLQREMEALGQKGGAAQKTVLRPVARRVQARISHQFEAGVGPDGAPQAPRKDGKPGLVSRKLGATVRVAVMAGGIAGSSSIAWLEAHQKGHEFPPRQHEGQKLTFNRRGRLLSARRVARAKFVFDRIARRHTVGRRVLPARPIYPESGELPGPWATAVNVGAEEGLQAWHERATK